MLLEKWTEWLFVIIMDKLTEDIRKDAPWDMLFADDIVLYRQKHWELKNDLEIWGKALERKGLFSAVHFSKSPNHPLAPYESNPEQDRVFEGWGCGCWRRVEAARRKAKESKKLQITAFDN